CIGLAEHSAGDAARIIIAPIQALMQLVPSPQAIAEQSRLVSVGGSLVIDDFTGWLSEAGFNRCDQVETPGDFALRGGILDIFSHSYSDPVRIELFGDEIESIRLFDASTQRSSTKLDAVRVPAYSASTLFTASDPSRLDQMTGFLAYLPDDTIIAINEPVEVQELGRTFWQRLGEPGGMINVDAVFRRAGDFAQLHLQRFGGATNDRTVALDVDSLPQFEAGSSNSIDVLFELANEHQVIVLCDNEPERQRLIELLEQKADSAGQLATTVGVIHRGFRWGRTAFVPHHEVFHRYRQRRTLRRVQPARPIDSFFDLNAGDYVVHVAHGIGRFRGLKSIEKDDKRTEYMAIQYHGDAVIHVPVSQIDLVQKYIGSFRGKPTLSKLGANTWKRIKERVTDAVGEMAADLLLVQAQRESESGVAYPHDTTWQREFEGSFIYTETEDQIRAIEEMKADLVKPRPMDRLLCGDVGFGKTELAMRAAFKVIEYGKQVAVLVPTTVLAEQHYRTFTERMADYPFNIEVLSRFRTKSEQNKIVAAARRGEIDILIGTHRLLSKDVRFSDLGLIVIDEEQRFGVEAKEKLKRLRATVEVLTMTATPIPRTLHMAMLGLKDISSLATPPLDRRSIVTQVRMWDDQLIRDAILRELSRDGQVFFVHNFVRDIRTIADKVQQLAPDARIVVGHGQMPERELERVMLTFMRHEADILVSTTIIESGIDIPAANTIFINRAERYGLADLHQLRGRVGRSKHRAYAYMLLSPKHAANPVAAKRLKAIEHYSKLGAGFQIAMRDLEIRGAGNILGTEQSGHIAAVGYELYCQLLDNAVRSLRREPLREHRHVAIDLPFSAFLPDLYVPAGRQKIEMYRKLSSVHDLEELRELEAEFRDRFGPPPTEARTLMDVKQLQLLAQSWQIDDIRREGQFIVFGYRHPGKIHKLAKLCGADLRVVDDRYAYLPLKTAEQADRELVPLVKSVLQSI
ncbi:MAG: transcription-repair coupling factor, partial [Planctomycetes bacterium]|nr:transcription-repair coupling factor [Planctomycetota bacterium]